MIGARERWSYAAGDLGFNFVWQSIELYLLYYYVRGLGLPPAVAASIFLAGAAIDWVVDPLVGAAADRWSERVPLRAWVAVGGPLAVLLLWFAFTPPTGGAIATAALVRYLALRTAYSIGNIPYAALTARISPRASDHIALTATRMQGAAIGGLIAAAVYALLPTTGAGGADFRDGALLLALAALPAFATTALGVRERVHPPARADDRSRTSFAASVVETATMIARSAELRRLLATILAAGLAVTVLNKSLLFLFDEAGARRLGGYVALVPGLSLLLAAPVWARVGARIGRPRTLAIAAALKVAAVLPLLVVHGATALIVLVTVAIVAGAGMSVMFWSLVPAAVADCRRAGREQHGIGYEARVYALSNVARKAAQALAPQVIAATLLSHRLGPSWGLIATATLGLLVILIYPPRARMLDDATSTLS